MIDEAEAKRLRSVETTKRVVAAVVTLIAAGCSWGLYGEGGAVPGGPSIAQPALAFMAALTIVCGARALEGPAESSGRRSREAPNDYAASLIRSWLTCFIVLELAFLLTAFSARAQAGMATRSKTDVVTLAGRLTVIDAGGRRQVDVTGREVKRSELGQDPSGEANAAANADTVGSN